MNDVMMLIRSRGKFVSIFYLTIFGLLIISIFVVDHFCIQYCRQSLLCRAVTDNLSHAFIAAIIWLFTCIFGKLLQSNNGINCITVEIRDLLHVGGAFLAGSLLDLDHFIMAKSFLLIDAVKLPSRPFGHTALYSVCFLILAFFVSSKYSNYLIICFSSTVSHILRDSGISCTS